MMTEKVLEKWALFCYAINVSTYILECFDDGTFWAWPYYKRKEEKRWTF